MKLKTIDQIKNISGKRVLLRLDLNVPLNKQTKVDRHGDWRLDRAVPSIKYLLKQKAKVIIVAHLGRPKGQADPKLSLLPVSQALSKKLKQDIEFWADDFRDYEEDSHDMNKGSVAMLENIRFEPREKLNCKRLAKAMAKLGDIYVNDAFGNLHRADSSMEAITNYLPAYAGFLIRDEIEHLSEVLSIKKGLVIIFGGAKAATKIKLIKKFSKKAGNVLTGGAVANTILKASGYGIGKSLFDKDSIKLSKELLGTIVEMPLDAAVASSFKAKQRKIVTVAEVAKNEMILDIGPETLNQYTDILAKAKLVIWNGPFGYFENPIYIKGSKQIMQTLIKSKAKVILGGGETVELAQKLKLDKQFHFISTGGGAMLTFLGGAKLPALDKLSASRKSKVKKLKV
ncbi:MAG: phosphoglycerate kinase [Candidatus Komeilibacteria bacterium]|jgi:phosphoglycerate kinase|nr:phosphoglycerate kinase [Candidatus Komeilibacteria bacterium]